MSFLKTVPFFVLDGAAKLEACLGGLFLWGQARPCATGKMGGMEPGFTRLPSTECIRNGWDLSSGSVWTALLTPL